MSNRSAASESKASAATQPNRFEAQAQAHSRLPALARQCLLQAHPSRIDGTSLFYIRISGLRIRQNGASLVFLFAPMIFLLAGLSLVLWCFLGRPLEPWTVVDRMVDSAMCGARCRSQPVTGRRDA